MTANTRYVYCARVPWGPETHYGPETHPFCEMLVVSRGGLRLVLGGSEIQAGCGDILFYPAETRHEEWTRGDGKSETIVAAFSWRNVPRRPRPQLRDRLGRIQNLMSWLAAEDVSSTAFAGVYRRRLLDLIIAEYLRLIKGADQGMIENTRAYIMAHLSENFGLDDLALHAQMSKYHFVRSYRDACGLTPMRDVQRIRLEFARQILLASSDTLKEIAPRVGISDEWRLSRLLTRAYGYGAREIRAQWRKRPGDGRPH